MKPKFTDVFWIINNEMFKPTLSKDWLDKKIEKELEYIYYELIIPVYVKSLNDVYDGSTSFDITPVDIRDGIVKNWRWSRSICDKEIGVTIFNTKKEALEKFNKKHSLEKRKEFSEKHELRKMYENNI